MIIRCRLVTAARGSGENKSLQITMHPDQSVCCRIRQQSGIVVGFVLHTCEAWPDGLERMEDVREKTAGGLEESQRGERVALAK